MQVGPEPISALLFSLVVCAFLALLLHGAIDTIRHVLRPLFARLDDSVKLDKKKTSGAGAFGSPYPPARLPAVLVLPSCPEIRLIPVMGVGGVAVVMYVRMGLLHALATCTLTLGVVFDAGIDGTGITVLLASLAAAWTALVDNRRTYAWSDAKMLCRLLGCYIPLGCLVLGGSTELAHLLWLSAPSMRGSSSARASRLLAPAEGCEDSELFTAGFQAVPHAW